MRKLIIVIGISLAIASSIYAQNSDNDLRSKLQFGIKAGTNISNVYDSQGEEFEANPRLGFVAGLFMAVPFGKLIGVQPEILFSRKGFNGSGTFIGLPYEFSRRSNYIDIPLMVQIKPVSFITFVGGPQFSFLLKEVDNFNNKSANTVFEESLRNTNIRKNILGFIAGADLSVKHFVVGARLGLDLLSNSENGSSNVPRYKNVWAQATIGFRIY